MSNLLCQAILHSVSLCLILLLTLCVYFPFLLVEWRLRGFVTYASFKLILKPPFESRRGSGKWGAPPRFFCFEAMELRFCTLRWLQTQGPLSQAAAAVQGKPLEGCRWEELADGAPWGMDALAWLKGALLCRAPMEPLKLLPVCHP